MPKTLSKEDAEDLRLANHMQDLVNSPAWKVYQKLLQRHIDEKMVDMLQPLVPIRYADGTIDKGDGLSHVLVGEAAKGAILGLRLALSLPSGIVSGAEQIRKNLQPQDAEIET